ncbi:MAG: GNAT family N-acetyltransferase [Candidatus Limnocylindrales bacterium]
MSAAPRLRPMTLTDVPAAGELLLSDGWTDRTAFFEFAVGHPACRPIVADLDGRVVATGIGTASGSVGWIALIFVAPDLRGEGLGRLVSTAVCDDLEARGSRTLLLHASDAGRPVYERLGFEIHAWLHLFDPPDRDDQDDGATSDGPADVIIRPVAASDMKAVEALDASASGEDRRHLIRAVLPTDGGLVAVDADGTVRGYRLDPSWGAHPLVAHDPHDAIAILEHAARAAPGDTPPHGRRAVTYDGNEAGDALLAERGWREIRRMPRMIRGEPLDWRPEWIYGNFNAGLG